MARVRIVARLLVAVTAVLAGAAPTVARETVEASPAQNIAVTIYRDMDRRDGDMDVNFANGFAMISETRTVALPPGESTVRFTGVAESMIAVSAIVTGLPGGTIEKNRDSALLSPAALVDGTLGNRVTVTRTNPATGQEESEQAVVRTRADGGLVLQTSEGFEAVRCAGLPEKLTFLRIPPGLSPKPVFSVDTFDASGGSYQVTLTYLAQGFDWQAHYVATFAEAGRERTRKLRLMAWLSLVNSIGQSFENAELMAVAGRIEVTSNYSDLAQTPRAEPLRLTCYPLGSSMDGTTPLPFPAPAPRFDSDMMADEVMVTAQRSEARFLDKAAAPAMIASEEDLGDLKLYRVPQPVTVVANAQKQIVFLDNGGVTGRLIHRLECLPGAERKERASLFLRARNRDRDGLGRALPEGRVTVFEPSRRGPLLVSEDTMRDYAVNEEVEIALSAATGVTATCGPHRAAANMDALIAEGKWVAMAADISNPSDEPIDVEIRLGMPLEWGTRRLSRDEEIRDGHRTMQVRIPAHGQRRLRWEIKRADAAQRERAQAT